MSFVAFSNIDARQDLCSPVRRNHRSFYLVTALILSVTLLIAGCNRHLPTAQVEKARKHLQLNRPQLAIESLAKDDSAEGHYLKAVALQSVGEKAAARQQINESLSIAPEDVKYIAYQTLLDLSANKTGAAQRLIDLFDLHPSSPAIAFFATRAFIAKQDVKGALRSFKLGLTLVDEVPEFMFHALQHSITTQQAAETKQLLKKLEQAAPADADFLRELLTVAIKGKLVEPAEHLYQRVQAVTPDAPDLADLGVKMELLLGRPEAALIAARKALEAAPNDPGLELLLAEALLRGEPKPERERELAAIAAKHSENPDYLARYANYLIRHKRLPEAVQVVNRAVSQTKAPAVRATLLNMAIRMPLDANDPNLAEQQLALHQAKFSNPVVGEYFMGRILFLKRDFAGSLDRFQKVVASQATESSDGARALAAECLGWQRRILASKAVDERLKSAQEEIDKIRKSPNSLPGLDKPSTTQSPDNLVPVPTSPTTPPSKPGKS
ncbi:MAG: hypothetical protein V4719_29960 [Planctomycetota bacterium]